MQWLSSGIVGSLVISIFAGFGVYSYTRTLLRERNRLELASSNPHLSAIHAGCNPECTSPPYWYGQGRCDSNNAINPEAVGETCDCSCASVPGVSAPTAEEAAATGAAGFSALPAAPWTFKKGMSAAACKAAFAAWYAAALSGNPSTPVTQKYDDACDVLTKTCQWTDGGCQVLSDICVGLGTKGLGGKKPAESCLAVRNVVCAGRF